VLNEKPEILNHNMETVPRLYKRVRPQAKYARSLELLRISRDRGLVTKTGMMLGLGEEAGEIESVLDDLVSAGCQILTLGNTCSRRPRICRWSGGFIRMNSRVGRI